MKYLDLNNKERKISLHKFSKKRNNASNLHKIARKILIKEYPACSIFEEIKIFVDRRYLYLDFFIKEINTVFEINGQQHYEFTPYFHKNKFDFFSQQRRDKIKKEWCELNNIDLIILRYDNIEQWEEIIAGN